MQCEIKVSQRRTVKLDLASRHSDAVIWITSARARKLLRDKQADVVSKNPLSIKMRSNYVQRWSATSAGFLMSGAVLEHQAPIRLR